MHTQKIVYAVSNILREKLSKIMSVFRVMAWILSYYSKTTGLIDKNAIFHLVDMA